MEKIEHTVAKALSMAIATLFLLVMATGAAFAQEAGQITGKVLDPQDRVVVGAAVTVKRVGGGFERNATTNDEGVYTVTALQPGQYEVTVSAPNFEVSTQRVQVSVGGKHSLETTLGIPAVGGTVDVVGSGGIEVNTSTQELSDVISKDQVRELPTLTRNPYDLVGISGNAAPDSTGRGASGFAINGQRAASTSILLDGAENVDNFVAATGQAVPLDSVQEFRIISGNFSAEYGRASGGIVNVATISGSNEFHGTGYGFNRISRLASNGFDNNARGIERQVFTRNQFGYSIGGPIIKDKLFFFNNTEWIRVRSGGQDVAFVPHPQLIAASSAATRNFFSNYQTSNPITGRVFTVAQTIASLGGADSFPAGNAFAALPGNLPAFGEVFYSTPQDVGGGTPQNDLQMVARIDWNVSNKTQFYGRYAVQDQVFAEGTNASSPWSGFSTGAFNFNQNIVLNLTHSFSSNLVSQTKLAFNRLNGGQPLGEQPPGPTLYMRSNAAVRLSGIRIGFPGYLPFSPGNAIPFAGAQNVYQLNQDLSQTRGNHAFRFGGQIIHMRDNKTFGAYLNSVEGLGSNNPQSLGNLVVGEIRDFNVAIDPQGRFPGESVPLPVSPPSFSRSNLYNEWAAYINDSWRVHPRVTLNLGLRYEYYGVQHSKDPNLDANFYYGPGANFFEQYRSGSFQRAPDSPVGGLWRKDLNNFAPRLGIAIDVTGDGKTSIRGGYGVAYERNFGNVTFNVMFNPPNYAVVSLVAPTDIPVLPIFSANLGPFAGTGPAKTLPSVSGRHVDENIRNAYAHFWSGSFEREVSANTVFSVQYSGSAGRKLYSLSNANRPNSGVVYLGSTTPSVVGGVTNRLNGRLGTNFTRGNLAYSDYNALIVSLSGNNFRRMGLTYTANYTFSKAKDNLSATFSDTSQTFHTGFLDHFDPKLDYGNADHDVRHRFSGSLNYEVPFFNKSGSGVARNVLGGWSIASIVSMRSGLPFTIYDCTFANETCARVRPLGVILARNGSSNPPDTGAPNQFNYIDLSGVTTNPTPNPISGNYNFGPYGDGMTQRNFFTGPGFWNVNMAVHKRIRFTENLSLQLRGEVFNVFNHANLFTDYGSSEVSNGFVPVFRDGRRNVQLAAKVIW